MPVDTSIALMARETRVSFGAVPPFPDGKHIPEQSWRLAGDRFLLRGTGDHWFHYAPGQGIVVERGPGADLSEEGLWLNGTIYSAVAAINGLVPIHASAVARSGRVVAFTGDAGAGKSTLVAALTRLGLPMFCDDTLVLDLSDPAGVMCLPGHKRLKLTPEALALTGARREEKVAETIDKYYATPAGGSVAQAMPMAGLVILAEGPELSFRPAGGAEAVALLQDEHYSAMLLAFARKFDRRARFAHLADLARRIPLAVFSRPRDAARFPSSVGFIAEKIASWPDRDGL